jgi:hypothetical protein
MRLAANECSVAPAASTSSMMFGKNGFYRYSLPPKGQVILHINAAD